MIKYDRIVSDLVFLKYLQGFSYEDIQFIVSEHLTIGDETVNLRIEDIDELIDYMSLVHNI